MTVTAEITIDEGDTLMIDGSAYKAVDGDGDEMQFATSGFISAVKTGDELTEDFRDAEVVNLYRK